MDDSGELLVGAIIGGKYRIDRVLGQGGMGIVYAATHLELDQRVALKFLLRAVAAHPEMVERFAREARAAVRIQSEHVARVLDVGTIEPRIPYIVMEFLEGDSLEALLEKGGPFPVAIAVDSVLQACEALAEAHSLGIVHRDIKPGNLFRARRPGRSLIKVLDFGICKVPLDPRAIGITGGEAMMGSPGYMSPEQIFGAATVDVRTDIWALGAVLYHLVAGRPPFFAETMTGMIAAVLHKPHEPVTSFNPNVSAALSAAIDACLQKEPAQRPANVAELAYLLVSSGPTGSAEMALRVAEVLGVSAPTEPSLMAAGTGPAVASNATRASRPFVRETTLAPISGPPSARSSRRATLLVVVAVFTGLLLGGLALRALVRTRPTADGVVAAGPPPSTSAPVVAASLTPVASALTPDDHAAPTASASSELSASASASAAHAPPSPGHVKKDRPHPAPSASAPAEPTCTVVSYVDDEGNKHFKRVCQ